MGTKHELVCDPLIRSAVERLGDGPLDHAGIQAHIAPLFSRVLEARDRTGRIYLANHSLGRPLDVIEDEIRGALDPWFTDLDGAWGLWLNQIKRFRAEIAALLGMDRPDSVVPKTSAAQGLRAVLNALPTTRPNIITTRAEFDSIDFVLKAAHHKRHADVRFVETDASGTLHESDIIDAIDETTDLVVCSLVCFASGQHLTRIGDIIDRAHANGALIVLDTYHAAGVIPFTDDARRADFMIGGSYKYTRGGPGACWLTIHPRHLRDEPFTPDRNDLFTTDTGWFAKHDTFGYTRTEQPTLSAGGDAWLEATPPVLTAPQALPGLVLTNSIGIERIRAYTLAQLERLTGLLHEHGVPTGTPEHHGAYLLVPVNDPKAATRACAELGVIADARPSASGNGAFLRLCPDLITTDDELERAAPRIAQALGSL